METTNQTTAILSTNIPKVLSSWLNNRAQGNVLPHSYDQAVEMLIDEHLEIDPKAISDYAQWLREVYNERRIERAYAQTRGANQRRIVRDMLAPWGAPSVRRSLQGSAREWGNRYEQSFKALLERLDTAGIVVRREPVPRGGEYGARYYIDKV